MRSPLRASLVMAGLACVLAGPASTGCGNTLKVQEEETPSSGACQASGCRRDVPGVPFYKKRPRRRQETERQGQALVVEVTVSRFDAATPPVLVGTPTTRRRLVADTAANRAALDPLVGPHTTAPDVEGVLSGLERIAVDQAELVANRIVFDTVLDTSRVYYINGPHPLVGSGSVNLDLSADQTLTKASATVDEKTFSTILSAIPVADLVRKATGLMAPMSLQGREHWIVKIGIASEVVTYKLRKELDACADLGPPLTDPFATNVEYERGFPEPKKDDAPKPKP